MRDQNGADYSWRIELLRYLSLVMAAPELIIVISLGLYFAPRSYFFTKKGKKLMHLYNCINPRLIRSRVLIVLLVAVGILLGWTFFIGGVIQEMR